MKVTACIDSIDSNCGVGYVSGIEEIPEKRLSPSWWNEERHGRYSYEDTPIENLRNHGGCGWLLSGFISNNECKAAYEALCTKHHLVYQSPVRVNANSGRRFFVCIFDTRRRRAT